MERRTISKETQNKVLPIIPNKIIEMLPESPESLLKYADRVKEIYFSPSIKDDNIKKLMKEHLLSDEEYLKTFYYVMALSFYNKKPVANPEIAIVAAQTGSGKSHLTAKILRENSNYVFVDSDKYKHFRYDAKKIAEDYPVLYPFLTGPDAYDHADNIYKYAVENGYNVIKETAPSPNKSLLGTNIDKKYKVAVHILAVGNINSSLSVHERYELQIISGLKTAKLTPLIRHNESYEALTGCVDRLINEEKVENIKVYTRGNKENGFDPIKIYPSNEFNSALKAIDSARNNDNAITKRELNKRVERIIDKMNNRNAASEQFNQIKEIQKLVGE